VLLEDIAAGFAGESCAVDLAGAGVVGYADGGVNPGVEKDG